MVDLGALTGWLPATGLPAGVLAGTATRRFIGESNGGYARANYGDRCGDAPASVERNRQLLGDTLQLAKSPLWLRQVHGVEVHVDDPGTAIAGGPPQADACIVRSGGRAAVVLTADCLPILLASTVADEVAAIHAGWRGLVAGVIEKTVQKLNCTSNLRAWLGPAIGPRAFEVGPEVRRAFVDQHSGAASCFVQGQGDRWFADLYGLARQRLAALGISAVSGGEHCTFSAAQDFHSFRRDGAVSGRMATLIWRR